MQEMAHIANGRDTGNSVSLLRVNVSFSYKFTSYSNHKFCFYLTRFVVKFRVQIQVKATC